MNQLYRFSILPICLSLGLGAKVYSQQVIKVNQQSLLMQSKPNDFKSIVMQASEKKPIPIFLKFGKKPNINHLRSQGIYITDYIGNQTYSALVKQQQADISFKNNEIKYWSPIHESDKISPFLFPKMMETSPIEVLISFNENIDDVSILNLLKQYGAHLSTQQQWKAQQLYQINIPPAKLALLSKHWNIKYITPKFEDQALNSFAQGQTNARNAKTTFDKGGLNLSGKNVTVGVGDDSDGRHLDYEDRTISFNPFLASNHGFHTSGTVGGAGIIEPLYEGYANKVNMIEDIYSQVLTNSETYLRDFQMSLTNNSYAAIINNCGYAGSYDGISSFVDQQLNNNPTLLHIFAAGNDARNTCSPFPLGYATVAGAYQTAKNVLVVASKGKVYNEYSASSGRGPIKDGRLKPEITAIGMALGSTSLNNSYALATGTSMACPNVAGAAALVTEYYKQKNLNQLPESALLKNILMNGSKDIGNPGPDFKFGYGLMNIGQSLKIIENQQFSSNTVIDGQTKTATIAVPGNVHKLKIMLTWLDPAAAPSSFTQLVNDLDLNVKTPNNITYFPLILNPDYSNVTDAAVQGADHLNNSEQVTIDNPVSGNYTIQVNGFDVPQGTQKYYLTYSYEYKQINIAYPNNGEPLVAGMDNMIYWDAPNNGQLINIDYTLDNGNSWINLAANLTSDVFSYNWNIPNNLQTGAAKIRISSGNVATTSASFAILNRPILSLDANQCPTKTKINWQTIPTVDKYFIYKKMGAEMQLIDSTTSTSYTDQNLSLDTTYWYGVSPVKNNNIGLRSVAISRLPNDGTCADQSMIDIALVDADTQKVGRLFTQSAFTNHPIKLKAYNLSNQTISNYTITYRLNNGTWNQLNITNNPIAAASHTFIQLPNLNMNIVGYYNFEAVVSASNQTQVGANDTLKTRFLLLPNEPLPLATPLTFDFEQMDNQLFINKSFGISNPPNLDFEATTSYGRGRNFVNSQITIAGTKSFSMDNKQPLSTLPQAWSKNQLIGTFNLSPHIGTDYEIRFDFDYKLHATPPDSTLNRVEIRGNDLADWIPVKYYDTTILGSIKNTGSISMNENLLAHNQTFSSSSQIRISQYDKNMIADNNLGTGLTIDNFKVYKVTDDIEIVSIENVPTFNCGTISGLNMKVKVANRVGAAKQNIPITYVLNNIVVNETIPNIPPHDTITYTFNTPLSTTNLGKQSLSIWVAYANDNYAQNDSLNDVSFYCQPAVNQYPYLENFENGDGYYFSKGQNSSWEYGMPTTFNIKNAANGLKAWKTGINTNYNSNENAALISPCFDLSTLNTPMLSFSGNFDIESRENDSNYFDAAWMEYSTDQGTTWQKLGTYGEGTNWYNNPITQVWTENDKNFWQVKSIALPKVSSLVLRWVFKSDQGSEFDGVALDDIHIFDFVNPIFNQDSAQNIVTNSLIANQETKYLSNASIIASVTPENTNATVGVQIYQHQDIITEDQQQYILPRNFALKSGGNQDTATLKLYVTEAEMERIRQDNNCPSCSHPKEVYQLGVTHYYDQNERVLNHTFSDDSSGNYQFIVPEDVTWIPYANGYYADFKAPLQGEYWFNDGGNTKLNPAPLNNLDFTAVKLEDFKVRLNWNNKADSLVNIYDLQVAGVNGDFKNVIKLYAVQDAQNEYVQVDAPILDGPFVFYRLRYQHQDGSNHYSVIRKIYWDEFPNQLNTYPNPVNANGLNISWFKGNLDGYKWELYNTLGQKITSGSFEINAYKGIKNLNFSNMGIAPGNYVLKLQDQSAPVTIKIVILNN